MKLSARNQLKGTVVAIERGAVNAIVKLDIGGGNALTSSITVAAVDELGLEVGKKAIAVVKASSVMVGVEQYFPTYQLEVVLLKDFAKNTHIITTAQIPKTADMNFSKEK